MFTVAQGTSAKLAATYNRGTIEYDLLNKALDEPGPRVRRANAHRQSPGDRLRLIAGINSPDQLEKENEQQFQYSMLGDGEIRLLRLYRSERPDEPLRVDLFKRKLEDVSGGYEALSYCWGNQKATYSIHIRDLNATTPSRQKKSEQVTAAAMWKTAISAITHTDFKVRKNLHDALRRLRRKYSDVYLWVDAICIDQSEKGKAEKEKQLAMMARIYNLASNVCVWLGEGYDGAEPAFKLIHEIMNYQNFDEMILNPNAKEDWRNLVTIMKAPWFSRRWVIQEIALSRDASIHCGDKSLHWDDFADAVSLLMEKIELIRDTFKDDAFDDVETSSACVLVQTLCNVCRKADQGDDKGRLVSALLDVETLVSTLLGFQATLPRDTIYSILSLARDYPELAEEWWQELHTEQLDAVRKKKIAFIDVELQATREKMVRLIEAQEKEKNLGNVVRDKRELIEKKMQEKQKARIEGNREEESRIDGELRGMQVQDVEYAEAALKALESNILQVNSKIQRLEGLRGRTSKIHPIGILPNYKFSPRDLFIAFVTRSISNSASLDIICRHWAPELSENDGRDMMPSWISSLSKSPFGVPGAAQGRQNGENFVAYLPHDQRRQYLASGESLAEIGMTLDPALDFQDHQNLLEINIPEFPMPETQLSIANHQLGLSKTDPEKSLSAQPVLQARQPSNNLETQSSATNSNANSEANSPALDNMRSRPMSREGDPKSRTSRSRSRRPSPSERTISDTKLLGGNTSKGNGPAVPKQRRGSIKQPTRRLNKTLSSAGKGQQHQLSGILLVKGFILGKIVSQSEVMRGGVVPGEWVAKLGWEKDVNSENRVPDTLWRLLVADRMEKGGKPPQWYKRACLHGLVDDKVSDNQGNIHPVTLTNRKISELTAKYFKRVESVVWNRRVFKLKLDKKLYDEDLISNGNHDEGNENGINNENPSHISSGAAVGRVPDEVQPEGENARKDIMDDYEQEPPDPIYGLAPQGSKVSDIVCILFGCSVPVVLSKNVDLNRPLYKVVGEAYVHGMMDGKAMEVVPRKMVNGNWEIDGTEFALN